MTASMNRAMQRITKGNPRRKLFITMALCAVTLLAANWARAQDAAEEVAAGAPGAVSILLVHDQLALRHV